MKRAFLIAAFLIVAVGCATTPVAPIATAPTTQPSAATPVVVNVQPTPAQVLAAADNAVVTYGPLVQAILLALGVGGGAAVGVGVATAIAKYFQANPDAMKTPAGVAALMAAVEAQITPLMPKGTTAAQIAAVVQAAVAAQAPKAV